MRLSNSLLYGLAFTAATFAPISRTAQSVNSPPTSYTLDSAVRNIAGQDAAEAQNAPVLPYNLSLVDKNGTLTKFDGGLKGILTNVNESLRNFAVYGDTVVYSVESNSGVVFYYNSVSGNPSTRVPVANLKGIIGTDADTFELIRLDPALVGKDKTLYGIVKNPLGEYHLLKVPQDENGSPKFANISTGDYRGNVTDLLRRVLGFLPAGFNSHEASGETRPAGFKDNRVSVIHPDGTEYIHSWSGILDAINSGRVSTPIGRKVFPEYRFEGSGYPPSYFFTRFGDGSLGLHRNLESDIGIATAPVLAYNRVGLGELLNRFPANTVSIDARSLPPQLLTRLKQALLQVHDKTNGGTSFTFINGNETTWGGFNVALEGPRIKYTPGGSNGFHLDIHGKYGDFEYPEYLDALRLVDVDLSPQITDEQLVASVIQALGFPKRDGQQEDLEGRTLAAEGAYKLSVRTRQNGSKFLFVPPTTRTSGSTDGF